MDFKEKKFNEYDFCNEIIPLINEGAVFSLKVSGGSMEPFLASGRDTVYISKPDFPLKVGSIAFFRRESGKIVMHRVKRIEDGSKYYFIGDAQTVTEGPIPEEAIFGEVLKIARKGKTVSSGTVWSFFEKIWIRMIPLRPLCFKLYRLFFGH